MTFVARVTTQGGPEFVPVAERIVTFDNDGTLWSEQPLDVQAQFVLNRIRELVRSIQSAKTTHPFKAVLEGDMKALATAGDTARSNW